MSMAITPLKSVLVVATGSIGKGRIRRGPGNAIRSGHVVLSSPCSRTRTGRKVDAPPAGIGRSFDDWRNAVEATHALIAPFDRCRRPSESFELRVGLEVAPAAEPDAPLVDVRPGSRYRGPPETSALGQLLASLLQADPPDRMVVVPRCLEPCRRQRHHASGPRRPVGSEQPCCPIDIIRGPWIGAPGDSRTLRRGRLVSITGPPGIGKTRIATEFAARSLGRYEGGAWFVSLAPLRNTQLVMSAVATVLGAPVGPGFRRWTRGRTHRRKGTPCSSSTTSSICCRSRPGVAALLDAAPNLHMVVTSQSRLGASGEVEFVAPAPRCRSGRPRAPQVPVGRHATCSPAGAGRRARLHVRCL